MSVISSTSLHRCLAEVMRGFDVKPGVGRDGGGQVAGGKQVESQGQRLLDEQREAAFFRIGDGGRLRLSSGLFDM